MRGYVKRESDGESPDPSSVARSAPPSRRCHTVTQSTFDLTAQQATLLRDPFCDVFLPLELESRTGCGSQIPRSHSKTSFECSSPRSQPQPLSATKETKRTQPCVLRCLPLISSNHRPFGPSQTQDPTNLVGSPSPVLLPRVSHPSQFDSTRAFGFPTCCASAARCASAP